MSDLLIAVSALVILSLIFGAILGFASIRFKVEGNPLVEQIDALLPQTQCGQCSYPGCSPYAEAIASGAGWQINNGDYIDPNDSVSVNPGVYVVEFEQLKFWKEPGPVEIVAHANQEIQFQLDSRLQNVDLKFRRHICKN